MKYDYFYLDGEKIAFNSMSAAMDKAEKDSFAYVAMNAIQDWLSGSNRFKLFTSGSTGKPKLIIISRQQILEKLQQ